jgi:hypothetical protein
MLHCAADMEPFMEPSGSGSAVDRRQTATFERRCRTDPATHASILAHRPRQAARRAVAGSSLARPSRQPRRSPLAGARVPRRHRHIAPAANSSRRFNGKRLRGRKQPGRHAGGLEFESAGGDRGSNDSTDAALARSRLAAPSRVHSAHGPHRSYLAVRYGWPTSGELRG